MNTARITICTLLLAASPALLSAQTAINESREVSPSGSVRVENISGSITLSEWREARVEVTGTLGRGSDRLDIDVHNGRTTIRVVLPDNSHRSDGSDLVVRVPSGARIAVETVSASTHVNELTGALDLESVSGRIEILGRPAALDVESVSGKLEVAFAPADSEIESVSGDIRIRDGEGMIDVANVSGDINITAPGLTGGEFATVSGRVTLETDLHGSGSFELESVSGSVTLIVPRDAAAEYSLSTFSGRIRNQIGPQAERKSRYTPGEEARFSIGDGGPRVSMSCFSGTVKLEVK